jgi:DNA invertase Pin-like site-specific DNA recombinase
MLIGPAHVSTQDQNLELHGDALSKAGCQKLSEDKVSGTRAERPGLTTALEMLRAGDTLVVWKLEEHQFRRLRVEVRQVHGRKSPQAPHRPTRLIGHSTQQGTRP